MLKEEQVSELLIECERIVGQRLGQIRGNLTKPENRSAAIFELLAIQAFAALGKVEYEPFPNSPDIRLTLPDGDQVWVEVAFLYDKYWKQERQSRELTMAMRTHAQSKGVAPEKISLRFTGVPTAAGYERRLPEQQDLKQFFEGEYVRDLFERIRGAPLEAFTVEHPTFSFQVSYVPSATSGSGGGLVQEAPKDPKQHQLYKIVKRKASQHAVDGMRIVCVGSDSSRALARSSAPAVINAEEATRLAFSETTSVGCVITVEIKHVFEAFSQLQKLAHPWLYLNSRAKVPMSTGVLGALQQLHFNRWKYSFELNQYQTPDKGLGRKLLGSIRMTTGNNNMSLEIPSALLVEVLAGREKLLEGESGMDSMLANFLSGDYRVESCSLIPANAQAGEGAKVKIDFVVDFDAVFERVSKAKSS
ncbi:Uncharacterised protein [Stutzerimonas stutzeri]|uniref:hypothetical protein n=1 Tax=Stutzerimonas stutzeri subgroup TaxID=578833 RepID=UPI000C6E05AF|nr:MULTISPECIES: hypothetical protein [Stutzerimonas stutzeri subgroup]MCQ2049376.1 hypothetical protein [Stutzerimonas kunmingensis]PKR26563.1 hypothetical protein CXK90_13045 [Stutzerimonas stutzeri]QQC09367.1 hypothetical protein I6I22_10760 [Stutzerimonas stutzeri]VEI35304.1 Uncharacterised protein [Stutzerimonas stutzeri]